MAKKLYILFVDPKAKAVQANFLEALKSLQKTEHKKIEPAFFLDTARFHASNASLIHKSFEVITANSLSTKQLHKAFGPRHDEIVGITCRAESLMDNFQRLIPHIPYIRAPIPLSLDWSTDKLLMRRRLTEYDTKITPKYTVVSDIDHTTINKLEHKVGYPMVVKPSGLAASMLVSIVYHREELEKVLKKSFTALKRVHKKVGGRGEAKILVEQFLEGTMYSVDAYVGASGNCYFAPPVHIKTGRSIGFDDFFGYQQLTPTKLKKSKIDELETVATKGIHALGLRSTIAHVEVIRTENHGFKIVEIAARMGGFRHDLYEKSYGFDHTLNDMLIRLGKKPKIKKTIKGYTVAMKFYSKKEGKLEKIAGLRKIKSFESFESISVNKEIGEMCKFAKNGGGSVVNVMLHNKDRSNLLADIRRTEQTLKITVEKKKK